MNELNAESRALIAEAAEWRLLALLFEYPTAAWRQQVDPLAQEVTHADLRTAADGARQEASEGLHIALFGPGGPVSLREVTYLGGVQLGYLMSELSAFYDAFGYHPETAEALDHLSVEAGFLSYLKFKQVYALACDDAEHATIISEAASNFVNEHLALVAEPIAGALENLAPEYLVHAGRFLVERIGPRPQSTYPLSGDLIGAVEAEEITCGSGASADSLIQLQP